MQLIGRERQEKKKKIVFKPSSETPKSDREATPPSGRCSYINNFTLVRTLHFVAFKPCLVPSHPPCGTEFGQ